MSSRRAAALVAAAFALFALAAVRGSGGGPPLYDGICLPPHYLVLGGNPPPPSRTKTYSAADVAATFEVADSDTNPQAQIIVGLGSLTPPAGATTATVIIAPVTPPSVKPPGGTIDGNVYSFDVQSGGHQLALAAGHPATVVLEAPSSGGPQPTLEHFDGTTWTPLKTFTAGCGTTFEAASPTLGLFALVTQTGPAGTGPPPAGGGLPTFLIVVVVVVVLALTIVAARLARQRRR
jgi:hypothetical protein